jgi:hypothetical protein
MPLAGFEPTIPVFKLAKTFHALDRAVTVTSNILIRPSYFQFTVHSSSYPLTLYNPGNDNAVKPHIKIVLLYLQEP